MVIQFPSQTRKRAPIEPQKTNLTGLYLLLVFALLYLLCVLWVQRHKTPSAATKAHAATVQPSSPPSQNER